MTTDRWYEIVVVLIPVVMNHKCLHTCVSSNSSFAHNFLQASLLLLSVSIRFSLIDLTVFTSYT